MPRIDFLSRCVTAVPFDRRTAPTRGEEELENVTLTFEDPDALGEVRVVIRIVGAVKFLLSFVADVELVAGVRYVPHLPTYHLADERRCRRGDSALAILPRLGHL